jgi:hypothetical protein
VLPDEKITELLQYAVKHVPSAFNSQSGRVVLLLGENHNKLWDATKDILRKLVPPEAFGQTEEKINGFRNGYGTVLFFEDQSIVESLQKQFELYKDNFPVWSLQSSGMLQYAVWTSLELEGLGASLQHYNPLIDDFVRSEWKIPANWKLHAQLVFGKPVAPAGEKEFSPVENRVKVMK